MNAFECPYEADVVSRVLAGHWPDGVDEELRAHAASCGVCADVVSIASVLRVDKAGAGDASVPAAGQVWWRAAIRARADAAAAAQRPMVWLQAAVGAASVGVALACVSLSWPRLSTMWHVVVPLGGSSLQDALPLLLAIGGGLIAAPIAFYLAVPRD